MLSRQTFHGGEFSNREISKELGIIYDGSQISKVYIRQVLLSCIHTDNSGIRYTWSQHYTPGGEFHLTLTHLTLNIYGDMISLL